MADFSLRAVITAVDKLSPVLARQSRQIRGWSKSFERAGRGAIPMAAGLGAAVLIPAKAFMQAEDAATQLKNTLMTKDGLSGGFDELSKIAVDLGNKLPGTTADFMAMASQLKALGTDTDTLIGGALKASAYLAVVGKPLGVTYDTAAEAVGKLSNAFGIAAKDMVPFTDTVQRALHMGIELGDLQYAMARIAGPLKAIGAQGKKVADDMVPLVGMLIKTNMSGEEAGTGIKKIIETLAMEGKYDGVKSVVSYLESINKLSTQAKLQKFSDLFGEQHAGKAAIIAAGGYAKMVQEMARQADMQQRINNSLGTLTNLWDAATGTFTNAMVGFATAYAPQLKELAQTINSISEKLLAWTTNNGPAIVTALKMAAAFVATKLALYGVGVALGFVARLMAMNPLGLFLQGVALAVPLIVANWDTVANAFKSAWEGAVNWVSNKMTQFANFVTGIANKVSAVFSSIGNLFPSSNGMTLPGRALQQKPLVSNSRFQGSLDINHVNAPQGFRAAPVQSKGPVRVQQNVGYNWAVTGN